ncbi:MAG: hypothetical protein Q8M29_18080 [Bacteroidota bacterium]|nr:hypothetical protein [Bacteroidota bacterium]
MKTYLTSSILLGFIALIMNSQKVTAQNNALIDDASIEKMVSENIKKGLPEYKGLGSSFSITIDKELYSTKDMEEAIASIRKNPEITFCWFDEKKFELTVMCHKQKENPTLADVKSVLADNNIMMIYSWEYAYRE